MKKSVFISLAFICIMITSCETPNLVRVATTTHQQIMDRYQTGEQVIAKFGIPTSKRKDGDYEEWYYLLGVKTVVEKRASVNALFGSSSSKNSNANGSAMGYGGTATASTRSNTNSTLAGGANANAAARTVSEEVKSYVKFTIKNNQVINWETNGVDYGVYEMKDLNAKPPKEEPKTKSKKKKK